jgi:hypothetical protein
MTLGAPSGAVFKFPVEQGLFKSDVLTLFLALNPLMAQDFIPLGQKFLIKRRFLKHMILFLGGTSQHTFNKTKRGRVCQMVKLFPRTTME